jgi:RND superfamily putative drug exporter
VVWFVLILCAGYAGFSHGGVFVQQGTLPGTETQKVTDALRRDFPAMTGPTATVVFDRTAKARPEEPRVEAGLREAIRNLSELDRVASVTNPYAQGGGGLKNQNAVAVQVSFKGTMGDVDRPDLDNLKRAVRPATQAGLDVKFGGIAAMIINQPRAGAGEAFGLVLALIVLLLAFGSLLAAGLPILISLCGLAVAYSLIHFGASLFELNPTAPLIAAMLGLGAGIDYALFIVTRYRAQLAHTDDIEAAVGEAMARAGHAVVFAGGTVVFAICGLFLSGITFIGRIGMAAAVAVAFMVLAALTLLPAVLGVLGDRIDRYKLPSPRRRRRSGGEGHGRTVTGSRWELWGRHVDRHAWPYAIGAIAVLLLMGVPTLSLRFGVMADSTMPVGNEARQAYDVVAREFGPGRYSPFIVVAKAPESRAAQGGQGSPRKPSEQAQRLAKDLSAEISRTPGVASVAPPMVSGDTALLTVVPRSSPHATETMALADRLRGTEIPAVAKRHPGAAVHLGGENAAMMDMADVVRDRMPTVMAAVVGVSLLLLVIAFRSILVPLKAALMNLLSIGASYGLVVAVFQWGWGIELLGLDRPAPIVSFVPLFMFALVFGLSMDYEVFLLSRIKEEYDRTNDPHGSVVTGIGSTARLISSAALIMIFVFASFLPQQDSMVKMMGLGMAAAVAVDATIVRLVLVPALMSLLGHANWWFPGRSSRRAAPAATAREPESA